MTDQQKGEDLFVISLEQLAQDARTGPPEFMHSLWERVRRYAAKIAHRWDLAFEGRNGVTVDDLIDTGYIALVDAVQDYDPEKGPFTHWYTYFLKKHFLDCYGMRVRRNDPLNSGTVSLDTPVYEDEDGTMLDTIEDPAGPAAMQAAEDRAFQEQLREAIEEALASIPDSRARVLRLHYLDGKSLKETGAAEGISHNAAWLREKKAIREIQEGSVAAKLWSFCSFDPYRGAGLQAFDRTGSSVQERYILQKERFEYRLGRGFIRTDYDK